MLSKSIETGWQPGNRLFLQSERRLISIRTLVAVGQEVVWPILAIPSPCALSDGVCQTGRAGVGGDPRDKGLLSIVGSFFS